MTDAKSENRFMEQINLFDRDYRQVRDIHQLNPLFAFLGSVEPTNIAEEVALFERYVALIKSYVSFHEVGQIVGDDVFFESLPKMVAVLKRADERSQCEFMNTWYDQMKPKLEAAKKTLSEVKELYSISSKKVDEVELSAVSIALKRIESAQARLTAHLDEAKNEEYQTHSY